MSIKPLTPAEVAYKTANAIPDFVISVVNDLLVKKYRAGVATLYQQEVVDQLRATRAGLTKEEIYDNGYLDFEPIFSKQGWSVGYHKPGWDEDFEPYWIFVAQRWSPQTEPTVIYGARHER